MSVTLNKYQELAMTTCMDSSRNYTYMKEGLSAEVGEFSDKIAKAKRKGLVSVNDDQLHYRTELTSEHERRLFELGLQKELGDVLWFVAGICEVMGWMLGDIADLNLEKLAARKAAGTIDGNGDGVTKEERG